MELIGRGGGLPNHVLSMVELVGKFTSSPVLYSATESTPIIGFNIFLEPEERSAKDIDEVIALAAQKKYQAVVDKTFPMSEVAGATRYLDERKRSIAKEGAEACGR
jgi:NADPH:quinone reductase-like Zn-dependent oxidoreductase